MEKPINIALASDAEYLIHARVTLCSLFDSNKSRQFAIYLFTESVSHTEIDKIRELSDKYNNSFHVVQINKKLFEEFFISGHISVATYYRLLIPEMLPTEVQKVLYLDTDIIIKKDIEELWKTDIQKYCLAAVDEKNVDHVQRLQLPTVNSYFNAGVLLINVPVWRQLEVTKRGLHLANKYKNQLLAHDQDILNMLLLDNWIPLSPKWNQTEGHRLGKLIDDPTIIHFVGFKPWTIHCIHPYKNEYYHYYYKMEGFTKKIKDKYTHYLNAFKRRIPFLKQK
ncbi:glycosyltransferase family 8 protein [Chitinophagaceae bacterium LB-8]|uniref:Glycosyltransferase family 8 protein n=1 Tax=Paraflavisolibacter caeni TaxID=2982496 RepID=A0A9X2XZ25_9BACT|nr:glycosyltransferase family 8 protein [Paraflavisolibacter caeni]MCU7551297.1 glycosyltransferase family 8 protein [Paraflavisolibacter caeni]